MSDLFKKLNVLIKANLNDLLTGESSSRPLTGSNPRPGPDIDRELAALHGRVKEALDYEQRLHGSAQHMESEIARLETGITRALEQGYEDAARQQQEQIMRARRGLELAQADLHEHQRVTQELIERVSVLDTYVAEAKRRQHAQIDALDEETSAVSASPTVADALRSMRENASVQSPARPPGTDNEDEMQRRRSRLSGPSKPNNTPS